MPSTITQIPGISLNVCSFLFCITSLGDDIPKGMRRILSFFAPWRVEGAKIRGLVGERHMPIPVFHVNDTKYLFIIKP